MRGVGILIVLRNDHVNHLPFQAICSHYGVGPLLGASFLWALKLLHRVYIEFADTFSDIGQEVAMVAESEPL